MSDFDVLQTREGSEKGGGRGSIRVEGKVEVHGLEAAGPSKGMQQDRRVTLSQGVASPEGEVLKIGGSVLKEV